MAPSTFANVYKILNIYNYYDFQQNNLNGNKGKFLHLVQQTWRKFIKGSRAYQLARKIELIY